MPKLPASLLSYLRVVAGAWQYDLREDAELLARFAESGDEAAFKALVYRHGPLVWRSCTQVLENGQDAEDAFQTAFMALARQAGRLRREPLAAWLHRVARRAALKVDAEVRRRRSLERHLPIVTPAEATAIDRSELYAALDEELAGLPERLRVPLLLHYIEGRSQVEVARILGCARRALQKRLSRGEAILRKRLERRGLKVGVVSVSALLGGTAAASAVPARLIGSTARAAIAFRSGALTSGTAEAARAVLEAFPTSLETTIMRKSLWIMLACSLSLGGAAVVACRAPGVRSDEAVGAGLVAEQSAEQPGPMRRAAVQVDCHGDPLPKGALARLGTVRLRHSGPIHSVAFSPDGKIMASGGQDNMVRLWEATTGKEIRTLRGHQSWVLSVAFSSDGKTVASGGVDNMVRLWDVATGKEIRTLKHKEQVFSVAFASDGKTVASGVKDGTVRLWEAATGKEICTLRGHGIDGNRFVQVFCVAFSPDSKIIASGGQDATVRLWEAATSKEIRTLKLHIRNEERLDHMVFSVAFSPDGKIVASGELDGTVRLRDVATGKVIRTLMGHRDRVHSVAFSPDGKLLATGSSDYGPLRLWDVATGKESRTLQSHEQDSWICSVVFSPDGKTVAYGGQSGTVRLWDAATGKESRNLPGHRGKVCSVAFASDSKTVASRGGSDDTVCWWETATGKKIRTLKEHEDGSAILSIAFSSDGKTMATGSTDGTVRLRDAATGKEIRILVGQDKKLSNFHSVAFSSDGKTVGATGGLDDTVYLWDVATGKEILRVSVHQQKYPQEHVTRSMAFSSDGRTIAVVGNDRDRMVHLWDVATGKEIRTLGGHQGLVSVAFSPDGKVVASGDGSGLVYLWEVAAGKEICALRGHQGPVNSVALASDGKIVASGGEDGTVRLWEVATGKEIRTLRGHRGSVCSVAFASDGRTLASGSKDTTGLIWNVAFLAQRKPMPARPLSLAELEAAWNELADADPANAYPVFWKLARSSTQALALLRARVRPVAPVTDPQQLKRWIADLDADSFTVRDKAQRGIEKLGEVAVPTLRQALKDQPPLEMKRRLQELLTKLEPKVIIDSPLRLRELRAVQVLESIGTVEARRVLQTLAQGAPGARLTVESQAALDRLAKRSASRP